MPRLGLLMALAPDSRLGPYQVGALLGAGGMGEVYRARDPRLEREVAVKVLSASAATTPDRLRRFEDEGRALAALNHPNILSVLDVGSENGSPSCRICSSSTACVVRLHERAEPWATKMSRIWRDGFGAGLDCRVPRGLR